MLGVSHPAENPLVAEVIPMKTLPCLLPVLACFALSVRAADDLPRSWIDPETGHRVVQLSKVGGTNSLYFTQYAYTAGGTKVVMEAPDGIDLATLATGEIERVYDGKLGPIIQVGRKSGDIYFTKDGFVCALNPTTKQTRQIAAIPEHGGIVTINSDETLLAGTVTEGAMDRTKLGPRLPPVPAGGYKPGEPVHGHDNYPDKIGMMTRRFKAHLPMVMFTLNIQTGERKDLVHDTEWLNHIQFSPTDPTMLMFCHEGPWWMVDRIWTIRADGKSQPQLIHQRTMEMEIALHEYWSNDGQWIWYDLQTPKQEDFWVGGCNVYTGQHVRYHLTRDQWSIHYNSSPDGKLFSGDGCSSDVLYNSGSDQAKYMYLFHPSMLPVLETPAGKDLIQVGTFQTEKLVSLANHHYSLEPNGNFSPDGKWLIFRSNMRGAIQVYAVEVAKAAP